MLLTTNEIEDLMKTAADKIAELQDRIRDLEQELAWEIEAHAKTRQYYGEEGK